MIFLLLIVYILSSKRKNVNKGNQPIKRIKENDNKLITGSNSFNSNEHTINVCGINHNLNTLNNEGNIHHEQMNNYETGEKSNQKEDDEMEIGNETYDHYQGSTDICEDTDDTKSSSTPNDHYQGSTESCKDTDDSESINNEQDIFQGNTDIFEDIEMKNSGSDGDDELSD